MLERSHIQSSGFDNVSEDGAVAGFRVRLRQPNYRGTRVSLVEGIDVTVDGDAYPAAGNRYRIAGREYAHGELKELLDLRWPVGTWIDVIVPRPGGLPPGVHHVETIVWYRHPYFPPQFRPIPVRDARHATIVL